MLGGISSIIAASSAAIAAAAAILVVLLTVLLLLLVSSGVLGVVSSILVSRIRRILLLVAPLIIIRVASAGVVWLATAIISLPCVLELGDGGCEIISSPSIIRTTSRNPPLPVDILFDVALLDLLFEVLLHVFVELIPF